MKNPKPVPPGQTVIKVIFIVSFVCAAFVSLMIMARVFSGSSKSQALSGAECSRVAKKIEARRLYDEIDRIDMAELDTVSRRDPHLIEPSVLQAYLAVDDYAKKHNTTLSRITFAERRKVVIANAVKNEGASPAEILPEEREIARQCAGR